MPVMKPGHSQPVENAAGVAEALLDRHHHQLESPISGSLPNASIEPEYSDAAGAQEAHTSTAVDPRSANHSCQRTGVLSAAVR